MNCCMCDGDLYLIGTLGNRDWYKCRDCGMEQSTLHDTQEEQ